MALRFRVSRACGSGVAQPSWLALTAVATAQEATETLTNQTFGAMVQNHLSVDVIIEAISTHPDNVPRYQITA